MKTHGGNNFHKMDAPGVKVGSNWIILDVQSLTVYLSSWPNMLRNKIHENIYKAVLEQPKTECQ